MANDQASIIGYVVDSREFRGLDTEDIGNRLRSVARANRVGKVVVGPLRIGLFA
jgi:hypothetical protein